MFIIGGSPPLGKKEPYEITTVSRSVSRTVTSFSSKTALGIFLKFLMSLVCLKGKILTKLDFLEKMSFWDNAHKHPRNNVFWTLKKNWSIDV